MGILRELSLEEIKEIYGIHLINHFPADEVKPLAAIVEMYELGIYQAYGFFEESKLANGNLMSDGLLGYAFFLKVADENFALLDYLAILPVYRDKGIGGEFLNALFHEVPEINTIFWEVENPDMAVKEEDKIQQLKRIAFYKRNGALFTGLGSTQLGVPYLIMYHTNGLPCDTATAKKKLEKLYEIILPLELRDDLTVYPKELS